MLDTGFSSMRFYEVSSLGFWPMLGITLFLLCFLGSIWLITFGIMKKFGLLALLLIGLASSAHAATLVAHYPLVSNATDISGNGYNGTATGSIQYQTIAGSACVEIANTTSYIALPSGFLTAWGPAGNSWEVDASVYITATAAPNSICSWIANSGQCGGNLLVQATTSNYFGIEAPGGGTCIDIFNSTGIPATTWTQVRVIWNGTNFETAYNGTYNYSTTSNGSYATTVISAIIGNYCGSANYGFQGYLHDLYFYNGIQNPPPSPTPSDTSTYTPTNTPSPTVSPTVTITPSRTPTLTASPTPTSLVTYVPAAPNGLLTSSYHGFNCMTMTSQAMGSLITDAVNGGYISAGYTWMHWDAGWAQTTRDVNGNLQGVSGISLSFTAAAAHAAGMKFDVYISAGTLSCPSPTGQYSIGSYQSEYKDLAYLSSQGVDGVAIDTCSITSDPNFNLQNEMNLFSAAAAACPNPMCTFYWGNTFYSWLPSTGFNTWFEDSGPLSYNDIITHGLGAQTNSSYNVASPLQTGADEWILDTNAMPMLSDNWGRVQYDMWSMSHSQIVDSLAHVDLSATSAAQKAYLQNPIILKQLDQDPALLPCYRDTADGNASSLALATSVSPTSNAWFVQFVNTSTGASTNIPMATTNIPGMSSGPFWVTNANLAGTGSSGAYLGEYSNAYTFAYLSGSAVSSVGSDVVLLLNFNSPSPTFTDTISPTFTNTPPYTATPTYTAVCHTTVTSTFTTSPSFTSSPTFSYSPTSTLTPTETTTPTPINSPTSTVTPAIMTFITGTAACGSLITALTTGNGVTHTALIVIPNNNDGLSYTFNAVTWDGLSFTKVFDTGNLANGEGYEADTSIWILLNPPSNTASNVTVTVSGSDLPIDGITALEYSNVYIYNGPSGIYKQLNLLNQLGIQGGALALTFTANYPGGIYGFGSGGTILGWTGYNQSNVLTQWNFDQSFVNRIMSTCGSSSTLNSISIQDYSEYNINYDVSYTASLTPGIFVAGAFEIAPFMTPTFSQSPTWSITPTITETATPTPTVPTQTATISPTPTNSFTVTSTYSPSPTPQCQPIGNINTTSYSFNAYDTTILKGITISAFCNAYQYFDDISVYVASGSGKLYGAIYQTTASYPNLLYTTMVTEATPGAWNTLPASIGPISPMNPGYYLIAVQGSGNVNFSFGLPGNDQYFNGQFGFFPFIINPQNEEINTSLYATFCYE
jgi:hypothetical protein